MTEHSRFLRQLVISALVVGCAATALTACKRRSAAQAEIPYPPKTGLEVYSQNDPQWKYKVAILDMAPPPPTAPELGAQLEAVGFTAVILPEPPSDGGLYNTVIEVHQSAVTARVLAPSANGRYDQNPGEAVQAFYARVVDGLKQHLQPVAPPPPEPEVVEPEPDPKEVCREECTATNDTCARSCCEEELGSGGERCGAAREASAKCSSECEKKSEGEADEEKRKTAVDKCLDGCRRGKHSAYPWDTKIAKDGSAYAKCELKCGGDLESCIAACDAEPPPAEGGAEEAPAEGAPAEATPAP